MNKRAIEFLGIAAIIASFVACGSDPDTSDVHEVVEDTTTVDEVVETGEMEYVIPSAFRIAMSFNRVGMPYEEGLTNDLNNLNTYQTRLSKHLNFGVYSADMSYCVLNSETDLALNYLENVLALSEDIGLSAVFGSQEIIDEFKNNMDDEEVLSDILTTIEDDMAVFLEEEGSQFTHAMIFSGAWIESVYIGSKLLSDDEYVSKKLVDEMKVLNAIIYELKKNPDQMDGVDDYVTQLEALRAIYEGFENFNMIEDAEDWDGIVFSEEELNSLAVKVEEIRAMIVAG